LNQSELLPLGPVANLPHKPTHPPPKSPNPNQQIRQQIQKNHLHLPPQLLQCLHNGGIMAALNIKQFPDELHDRLRARAGRDHRSVAQEVIHLLDEILAEPKKQHAILELAGLGKQHFAGIEAAEFVAKERDSWT